MTIKANVSRMFLHHEPWDVSNSVLNLGPDAGRLTWENAQEIAESWDSWLVSDLEDANDEIEGWARETGAWTEEELAKWPSEEVLALFVQNVASELRLIGSDDLSLEECAQKYTDTNWDGESEYPTGIYSLEGDEVIVEWFGS